MEDLLLPWVPIFTTAARCDILIRALEYCRPHKDLETHGWVILDNHFHAILAAPDLSGVLADLKRHTARRLIEHWRARTASGCPISCSISGSRTRARAGTKVWQKGSHPQALMSDAMMKQKLEHLHNNPVKRGLVASPEHWRYSSAHEWLRGALPLLRVDAWR